MYLGIEAVVVKSFRRIHNSNLVNYGILPLLFSDSHDYKKPNQGDELAISNVNMFLKHRGDAEVRNLTKNLTMPMQHALSLGESEILLEELFDHFRTLIRNNS